MSAQDFKELTLHPKILKALEEEGYKRPTPVQAQAIPPALLGQDVLATAQTGTGKTAAFTLPILHKLWGDGPPRGKRKIRALMLTPTRELALQIQECIMNYSRHLNLRSAVILGGVPQGKQVAALKKNPDILVATPGRLLDLVDQAYVYLDGVQCFVLDEADRMLDMGFIHDVKKVVALLPKIRQTLFFSATVPGPVAALAESMLQKPAKVEITPSATIADNLEQWVLMVDQANKQNLLIQMIKEHNMQRCLVFTRTKHRANRLAQQLSKKKIKADAIHSNKTQGARQRALRDFDKGKVQVLVATDIVARGIDVDGISHVFNFELPHESESYVHRIGRTARAGAKGMAFSFCDAAEVPDLLDIEKLIKKTLPELTDHEFRSETAVKVRAERAKAVARGRSGGKGKASKKGKGASKKKSKPQEGKGHKPGAKKKSSKPKPKPDGHKAKMKNKRRRQRARAKPQT